jgi:hypothetical protein
MGIVLSNNETFEYERFSLLGKLIQTEIISKAIINMIEVPCSIFSSKNL